MSNLSAVGIGQVAASGQLPSTAYAAGVAAGRWQRDAAQERVLQELDRIHRDLVRAADAGVFSRIARHFGRGESIRGLYLWGGVGRGKTFLVDLFFEQLPLDAKRRVHFHRFMQEVHARIRDLGQRSDPLEEIAAGYAAQIRVLCLDEFFVADIGDAMLLGRLLDALFARGVVLVTTSNTPPENLYPDGLQRARFLPAIALLQRACAVRKIESATDYRLRSLTQAPTFHHPLGPQADAQIEACYVRLTADTIRDGEPLLINGRSIATVDSAEGVAWFEFEALCDGPRAVADYIEVARAFHTVLLADVPRFDPLNEDAALRFVHLVDELYDRNVNLIVTAAALPTELYRGKRHAAAFARTESRLIEMQSEAYLAREHRP
jgi:cell division protein ZapE